MQTRPLQHADPMQPWPAWLHTGAGQKLACAQTDHRVQLATGLTGETDHENEPSLNGPSRPEPRRDCRIPRFSNVASRPPITRSSD